MKRTEDGVGKGGLFRTYIHTQTINRDLLITVAPVKLLLYSAAIFVGLFSQRLCTMTESLI